jgi:hypothetical protein
MSIASLMKTLRGRTKAQLLDDIEVAVRSREETSLEMGRVLQEMDILKARNKSLVAEKHFWSEQGLQLANQVETWQRMYRELLEETMRERNDVDIRAYAKAIGQAIEDGKPRAADVAAVIAMADRNVQGIAAIGFDPGISPKRIQFRDVGEDGVVR